MKRAKRWMSSILIAILLFTSLGFAEVAPSDPTAVEDMVGTEEDSGEGIPVEPEIEEEPLLTPAPEPTKELQEETVEPIPEIPDADEGDAQSPLPPKVVVPPEWDYDEETGALTVSCAAEAETFALEWEFAGEAAAYAVQTAPLPEEDESEVRGERVIVEEPRVELPVEPYSDGGWHVLYIAAILADGAEIEGAQRFRLEQQPPLVATDEPIVELAPEPTDLPVIDMSAQPEDNTENSAVEEISAEPVAFAVRIEKSVNSNLQIVLKAVVEGAQEGEIAYRWQSLDSAAYEEALLSGELSDMDTLWEDVPGATEAELDVYAAFGEAYADYSYRCEVIIGEETLFSSSYRFDTEYVVANSIMTMAYSGNDYTNDPVLAKKLSDVMNGEVAILKRKEDGVECKFKIGESINTDTDKDTEYFIVGEGDNYSGYQCYIFANALYFYLFGDVPVHGNISYKNSHVALEGLESLTYAACKEAGVTFGTYIRTTINSDGSYNGVSGHSLIVLKYDQSTITWIDCNYDYHASILLHTASWESFNQDFTT